VPDISDFCDTSLRGLQSTKTDNNLLSTRSTPGFYGGAIAYAVGPLVGLGFDTATITSTLATVPVAAKFAGKVLVAYPFTFHAFNGIRHLLWDTARGLTLKGVYATGYTVLGLSTVSAVALALI
jgi:succinate dehydrogenase (ubiquinone) cytochrome b560 subunit